MQVVISEQLIRRRCGRFAYEDGAELARDGLAKAAVEDAAMPAYRATVEGDRAIREVTIRLRRGPGGEISDVAEASCTCPLFHPEDQYCKHVAAALIHIRERELAGEALASNEAELGRRMLALFDEKPEIWLRAARRFRGRATARLQWSCKPVPYAGGRTILGLELKLGEEKAYAVRDLAEWLASLDQGVPCSISKSFTYDPEIHMLGPEDEAIVRRLLPYVRDEAPDAKRTLPLVPTFWESIAPLLAAAPRAEFALPDATYEGMPFSEETLPLSFAFEESGDGETAGYRLRGEGIEGVTLLEPYGLAALGGVLYRLPKERLKRLAAIKTVLDGSPERSVPIRPEDADAFMAKVVPGLMKLGSVRIAEAVSERMVRSPLRAKVYLDRIKDRLLVGLAFQYGEVTVAPLEAQETESRAGRILVRDGEKERRILELLDRPDYIRTEGGVMIEDDDEQYEFLTRTVPELEKLAQVFATSAVKSKLVEGDIAPRLRVEWDERTDWLDMQFEIDGLAKGEIGRLVRSILAKRPYHRLPGGAFVPLESRAFQEIGALLQRMDGAAGAFGEGTFRLPVARGLAVLETEASGGAIELGKSFRRLAEHLRNPDHRDEPIPPELEPKLREYQKYGYQWFKTLAHYRFGGILADEMGLGKTIQSIAFLVSALPEIRASGCPALVVCPTSLMYNWLRELERFAPMLRVRLADGTEEERRKTLLERAGADVVVASYPLLRRDASIYAGLDFHTVVLDEAQAFKNDATQTARAVKALRARHRFALTGTPIENRLEELWSIFDVVLPGLFPGKKAFGDLSRDRIASRIRPFVLRRRKVDVLRELPEKIETVHTVSLLPEQKKLYVAYLAALRSESVKHLAAGSFQKQRIRILAGITRLRQLCCHPALFVEGYDGGSAKFEALMELVDELRSAGRRMLVFSQFTEMLGLISRGLTEAEVPHFYLDGQTTAAERVERCDRFNRGERDVFLLSLKAGGTGLNLTGADTVILYDLWWNPAVEQQAADRAHRIGQKRVVQVVRLIAEGTLEEKMQELQQRKLDLIGDVIRSGDEAIGAWTEEEIRELLFHG
ncbi:DEAD/DEAH box helicase [Paenibacillus sp. TRM 82003]|nr:DEAD/DEAH box helicase [Paenibacillus sp. TRM 82003]